MSNAQRAASAVNTGNVVLDGPENRFESDAFLTGCHVNTVVNDGTGASTTDGCEPLVGFTAGRIAFIDHGNCQFALKSLNAEQAGAGGVIIADNQVSTDPFTWRPAR
jgi:hypothetical protein